MIKGHRVDNFGMNDVIYDDPCGWIGAHIAFSGFKLHEIRISTFFVYNSTIYGQKLIKKENHKKEFIIAMDVCKILLNI